MSDDPQPVVTWYRVVNFAAMALSAVAAFALVPQTTAAWISLGAGLCNLALVVFFNTSAGRAVGGRINVALGRSGQNDNPTSQP